jgi:hypothetical protein
MSKGEKNANSFPIDCQCGFEAGKIGYAGGTTERWEIRCTRSTCKKNAVGINKDDVIKKWNNLQSKND